MRERAQEIGAVLNIASQPGQGTQITVSGTGHRMGGPMVQPDCIPVIVVDDHELLRGGIRFALLAIDDIELVGEAHHGLEALNVCAATQPDVVLMDLHLPGELDGVATTKAIRVLYPAVQVVALSSYANPDQVRAILQAGAIGYLVKGVSVTVMADAIRRPMVGGPP